jgi:hypothetical protein
MLSIRLLLYTLYAVNQALDVHLGLAAGVAVVHDRLEGTSSVLHPQNIEVVLAQAARLYPATLTSASLHTHVRPHSRTVLRMRARAALQLFLSVKARGCVRARVRLVTAV